MLEHTKKMRYPSILRHIINTNTKKLIKELLTRLVIL